jgi:hypothetical protein
MMEKEKIALRSDTDYYGASYVAAKYCGMDDAIATGWGVSWQHGWKPPYANIHPYMIVAGPLCNDRDNSYLVAREDQRIYLQSEGYKNVTAIGLPIIYAETGKTIRKSNSLLVMPVHSLELTTHGHWGFEKYVEEINRLRQDFDEVAICIHPSCIKKGYWVNEFKKYGYPIIEGASIDDKNALPALLNTLSSYEYVTTNGFGSHLAYAAYCGAKVSIWGDYPEYKMEDFKNEPFYVQFPEALPAALAITAKEKVQKELADFFVFPKDAVEKVEWGKNELGFYNKVSPAQLKKLLGWDLRGKIQNKSNAIKRRIYGKLKQYF